MSFENEMSRAIEGHKIRKKLHDVGAFPLIGPTGPKGERGLQGPKGEIGPTGPAGSGLNILGTYNSYDELINNHPIGNFGDCYLVNGTMYVWDTSSNAWSNAGNIQGPTGLSEKIVISDTKTGEAGTLASIVDDFDGEVHRLEFVIPRGSDGKQGPPGSSVDTPTSYDGVLFASFVQANYSKIMTFQELIEIPEVNDYFELTDNTNITLKNPGIYEITLCGQISGVDQSHGAIFYLSDTNGAVIQDLSFEVKAGTTTRMDCSELILTKINTSTTLYVRCGIIGDSSTANIDFTNVNLMIKKYHTAI